MENSLSNRRPRMVGYGRVSTDEDKQLYSLKNQVDFFTEFANSHNYRLVEVYADEGISGKQLKKRDDFLRMLSDAEIGKFDVVVVKDVSRFARNTVDLLTSVRKLKSMGINVLFVNNNQQTMGESEFVITLLGAMAQEESANLSKRVKFGKAMNAKKGRVPLTILGYDRVDNFTMKINEDEASLIRRIYSMYLSGECGMAHIATVLRGEQITTKNGCAYTEGYIRRILTNPIYYGELVNHKSETLDFINGSRKVLPDEERFHHDRPELAIISKEDFDEVQRIREERCQMMKGNGIDPRRRYTSRYLFSGLVYCAECGRVMFRQNNKRPNGKVDAYWRCPSGTKMKNDERCNNNIFIRDDELVNGLSEILKSIVSDKRGFAQSLRSKIESESTVGPTTEKGIEDIERTRTKLLKQKEKYVDMCANDAITIEELKQYTKTINQQLSVLEDSEKMIAGQKVNKQRIIDNINTCISEIDRFLSLDGVNNSDLKRFLSRVEVKKDRQVQFIFKVRPMSG